MQAPRTYALAVCLAALVALANHNLSGSAPDVGTNQWAAGPPLGIARSGATAIALGNGNVLIAGGRGAAGILASAEIVTSSGAVLGVGSMSVPRSGHAAVALDNGRVLVVGGTTTIVTESGSVEVAVASAEIYDTLANVWYPAGSLSTARGHAAAARLSDGRVAIAGSADTVEIFNPETSTFSHAGTLGSVREGAAVATTRSGRLVIVGGTIGGVAQASADIVDLESGVVASVALRAAHRRERDHHGRRSHRHRRRQRRQQRAGDNGDSRPGHRQWRTRASACRAARQSPGVLLPHNGGVLLVGGTGVAAPSEVVIPWVGAMLATPPVAEPRSQTAGAGAAEGAFLVAGGSNAGGAQSASTDYYGFATVKTDKDDYAPGEFVTITGTGWQPGETVNLVLHEVGTGAVDTPLNAVADELRNFRERLLGAERVAPGVRFYLTATGAGATAQATFTDGIKDGSVVVGSQMGTLTQGTAGRCDL